MTIRNVALQTTIPDRKVWTPRKFSPPPTYNIDNQVFFPFCWKKTHFFPTLIRGNGGYVIYTQVSQQLLAGIVAFHADVLRLVTRSPFTGFTNFSRVLPTSHVVYCSSKTMERVVYCLNKDYFFRLLE